jgi:hypothetical protein
MLWRCIVIGMLIGVIAEIIARVLRLWLFRHPLLALLNVLVVYGLIMGALASRIRPLGALLTFAIAAAVGLAYELANLQFLRFWRFPDERDDGSAGRAAMVLVISLLWGLVPLITARAEIGLRRGNLFGQLASPAEELDQRQRVLLEKRGELQNRLRDVETRLRAIDRRKQRLHRKLDPPHPDRNSSPPTESQP